MPMAFVCQHMFIMHHSLDRSIKVRLLGAQQQVPIADELRIRDIQYPFNHVRTIPRIAGQLQILKRTRQHQFAMHVLQIVPAQIQIFQRFQIAEQRRSRVA